MQKFCKYILIISIISLASCGVRERHPITDKWLAVLPFENETNDLEIAGLLRNMFKDRLEHKGYRIIPNDTVDARLLNIGITDGGQLPTISKGELADTLKADILAYGRVIKANYITLGVYLQREVEMEVSLFRLSDSLPYWKQDGRASSEEIYSPFEEQKESEEGKKKKEKEDENIIGSCLLGTLKLIGIQLAEKTIMDMIGHPLYSEAYLAVKHATKNLPSP